MELSKAKKLIGTLVQDISVEINGIKSYVFYEIFMQVAIYAHDKIDAQRSAFGRLSISPSLDAEELAEIDKEKVFLLNLEQRRNALKHLLHVIEEGNQDAMQLLNNELQNFFSEDENYKFILEPETEHPNEQVKPYPYSE